MIYKELNEFLSHFNTKAYNKNQIGYYKPYIVIIYNYLKKINISEEKIETIIRYLAYLKLADINIALYLELISRTIGYETTYSLEEILKTVTDVHNIYKDNLNDIELEDYIHENEENRTKKLFLNKNKKYLEKIFASPVSTTYLEELKFAGAIELNKEDYKEFTSYLNNFKKYENAYSPVFNLRIYNKLRTRIKNISKLFWDIIFGIEYIVSLLKNNINLNEIYKENVYKTPTYKQENFVQLDLFTYQEESKKETIEEPKVFQICTIYNSRDLPEFEEEKDLLVYYHKLLNNKQIIILPKLKNQIKSTYIYETN